MYWVFLGQTLEIKSRGETTISSLPAVCKLVLSNAGQVLYAFILMWCSRWWNKWNARIRGFIMQWSLAVFKAGRLVSFCHTLPQCHKVMLPVWPQIVNWEILLVCFIYGAAVQHWVFLLCLYSFIWILCLATKKKPYSFFSLSSDWLATKQSFHVSEQ